eukprot:EG_transcript_7367
MSAGAAEGPTQGFGVYCSFGKEVEAATEARGVLGHLLQERFGCPAPLTLLTPQGTRHKGLVLLHLKTSEVSAVALYCALVQALALPPSSTPAAGDRPTPVRHCLRLVPFQQCCAQTEADVRATTQALGPALDGLARVAVCCLPRGDDRRLPSDEPFVEKGAVIEWVLAGCAALAPQMAVSLTAAERVVLVQQLRTAEGAVRCAVAAIPGSAAELRGGSLTVPNLLGRRLPSLVGRVKCTKVAGMALRGTVRCEEATAFDAVAKADILFRTLSPETRAKMQLDEYLERASTSTYVAERMARMCAAVLTGVNTRHARPCPLTVTDATAGVGCCAIGFLQWFAACQCVELEPARARMLAHNVGLARAELEERLPGWPLGRVTVQQGNYLDLLGTLQQDLVSLDPPWPRVDLRHNYRHVAARITPDMVVLSEVPVLHVACALLLLPQRCRVVILRLPITSDVAAFRQRLADYPGVVMRSPVYWGKAKMVFLVLHRAADGGLPPDSDVDIDMEAEEECGDTPAAAAPALGADHTVHTANPQQTEGSSSRPIDTTVAIG